MTRRIEALRVAFERLMEWVVIVLMMVLFLEVTIGVLFRAVGHSLVWYDEIASVLLAWLTYYASALAAFKRAHIGFPGIVQGMEPRWRLPLVALGEVLVIGFFVLLAWIGYSVLDVLATDTLVSLPEISVAWTQSVIPIGATLFVIAQVLNLPVVLGEARARPAAVRLASDGKRH